MQPLRLAFLILTAGFAMMLVEVRFVHMNLLREYPIAIVAVIASTLGLVASVLGLVQKGAVFGKVLFGLVAVSGVVGFFKHIDGHPERIPGLLTGSYQMETAQLGAMPPLLAPLSLSGLALVGFALLMMARDSDQSDLGQIR